MTFNPPRRFLALLLLCLAAAPACASVDAPDLWFSLADGNLNNALNNCELTQRSFTQSEGWGSAAENTILQNWSYWNGKSDYRITANQNLACGYVQGAEWRLADLSYYDPNIVGATWIVSTYDYYTDQYGAESYRIHDVLVELNTRDRWITYLGTVQQNLDSPAAHRGYQSIQQVTRHESGHVWGHWWHNENQSCSIMHPVRSSNQSITSVDLGELTWNYNTRFFH